MPDPLKSFFNARRVDRLAKEFTSVHPEFPAQEFRRAASHDLQALELLDRARLIARALAAALPPSFPAALDVVMRSIGPPLKSASGNGMEPFHYLPHTLFVAERGLDHVELSLAAQRELTRRFSCEFSIRPFLERHPVRTLAFLAECARDPDEHVRRLASEGTRPRLPWAPRLRRFQVDPAPVLSLLELLKDDPSEYVRRSVANNLNDVSKDHPALVLRTCRRWLRGASPERRRLVEHALRSLVRAGDPAAVRLLGGDADSSWSMRGSVAPRSVPIGGSVRVEVAVRNAGEAARVVKTVSLVQHSTRTHYPGVHVVDLVLNGEARPLGRFRLVAAR